MKNRGEKINNETENRNTRSLFASTINLFHLYCYQTGNCQTWELEQSCLSFIRFSESEFESLGWKVSCGWQLKMGDLRVDRLQEPVASLPVEIKILLVSRWGCVFVCMCVRVCVCGLGLTDVQMCRPYGSGTPVTVQLTPHRNVTDAHRWERSWINQTGDRE